jgi:predicted nucleic acid-binding protein
VDKTQPTCYVIAGPNRALTQNQIIMLSDSEVRNECDCFDCDRCGAQFFRLYQPGGLIGAHDLWLAASALANDCSLVTRNVREFERVPGLSVEVW